MTKKRTKKDKIQAQIKHQQQRTYSLSQVAQIDHLPTLKNDLQNQAVKKSQSMLFLQKPQTIYPDLAKSIMIAVVLIGIVVALAVWR